MSDAAVSCTVTLTAECPCGGVETTVSFEGCRALPAMSEGQLRDALQEITLKAGQFCPTCEGDRRANCLSAARAESLDKMASDDDT